MAIHSALGSRHRAGGSGPPNKRMQLTKLRAAPVLRAEVPPCAPAGEMDGVTASQLIRSVRRTLTETQVPLDKPVYDT
jgi:hypothetical protein